MVAASVLGSLCHRRITVSEPLRGIRQVLLAWPDIARAVPKAQLLLVGEQGQGYGLEEPPGEVTHLMTCLAQLPKNFDHNRIHVLGRLNHLKMLRLLQCSAAHLALSYPYTLSWSCLEALACGTPVITNHGSPLARELETGTHSPIIAFNDPHELANATVTLLNQPQQRRQLMGREAQRLIQERFARETCLMKYEEVFHELLSSSLSP